MHRRIACDKRRRSEVCRHAIHRRDQPAGFADQQNSSCDVPGPEAQLPEGLEPSRRQPREIDCSRSDTPDSGGGRGDGNELPRVSLRLGALTEWKAGSDQRACRIGDVRDVNRCAVEPRPVTQNRCEELVVRNVQYDADDWLAIVYRGDRYGKGGNSMQEIGGPVERVDDEAELERKRLVAPAFLAQHAQGREIRRKRRGERLPDRRFRSCVDLGEIVRLTLALPHQLGAARRACLNYQLGVSRGDDHRVEDLRGGGSVERRGCLGHGNGSYISRMARVFSGIQPSGELHIGNYLGAIRNWVELQHRYESFFCIVDYHAITGSYEPADLRRRKQDMAISLLAAGIDPEKCTLFVQSEVPEHTELAWIFNTVTPLGELERQTQYKDKSSRQESLLAGLLNYPVLQAADVALYQSELIPVGEDQVQHLELAREIVRRWNAKFEREYFVEPKPLLTPTRRIMGLDGKAKMSKSLGNTIGLLEEPAAMWEKLRPAATDPARVKRTDPGTPEICNIYHIHKAFSQPATVEHVAMQCRSAGWGCIDCKRVLLDSMETELGPIRARAAQLRAEPERVADALAAGADAAKLVASQTLDEAKHIMGLR